eukprot:2126591-Lingulodinium_polyedra.AAC.1
MPLSPLVLRRRGARMSLYKGLQVSSTPVPAATPPLPRAVAAAMLTTAQPGEVNSSSGPALCFFPRACMLCAESASTGRGISAWSCSAKVRRALMRCALMSASS